VCEFHLQVRRSITAVIGAHAFNARKETGMPPIPFLNDASLDCRASGETEPRKQFLSNNGRRRRARLHCCLYVPGSSPCKTLDDRRVVQMEQSLAGRSRSKSLVSRGKKPADNRSLPHLVRSSLPYGKACSAWGSNNRVLEKMFDPQR
jgi:hypothetical protein